MRRIVVVVLDGFGIGAMDDVPKLRPADSGSSTCRHIFERVPGLRLPTLERLGLGNALLASESAAGPAAPLPANLRVSAGACFGYHLLAHHGADTFWGHQELMGTRPLAPVAAPFAESLDAVEAALAAAGRRVERHAPGGKPVLVVDGAVTVGDNLETDLGNNYNVTAALDLIPFEEVRKIGAIVRSLVKSSRVIVFGGRGVGLSDILAAYEWSGPFAGVNAPRSGVYREGYQVVHLGYGVDPATQVPNRLAAVGVPVALVGKVADIVENPGGLVVPGVDTKEVLRAAADALRGFGKGPGFVCVNVQETDLAGHREDAELYARRLETADAGIAALEALLGPEDLMIVAADHGNDPTIGHAKHTREKTPLLVAGPAARPGFVGERASLADIGATVADCLGAAAPQSGSSYLDRILADKEKEA